MRGRCVRFAVAQDARGSDPSLATTRNPRNVSFKGLRPRGAFGVYDMVREGYVLARQSVTGTRISTVTAAGSVIFCRVARQIDCGVLRREKSERGESHDRLI